MVPEKRKLIVVGAAVAAAFTLSGCAPAGYNAADYGVAAEPAANEVAATATPTATPGAETDDEATAEGDDTEVQAPELSEDQITTELKAVTVKRMGETVQDQDGWVLYRFDKDKSKPEPVSNCEDDCAKVWPPVLIQDEKPELDGVDASEVGTIKRSDGTTQLTIGDWPVYRYIGDKKPGKWSGQNVGGKWFVVNPDGTKNLTCLPKISKGVPPPADDDSASEDESSDDDASQYTY